MEELFKVLAPHGLLGGLLAYFIWKNRRDEDVCRTDKEKAWEQVAELRDAVNRLTLAELIRLTLSPHLSSDMKTQLRDLVKEVEEKARVVK